MVDEQLITTDRVYEYKRMPWGELIYGTKEQLQGIGLGVGLLFPGEEFGPKRTLKVTDPRGFECTIGDSHYGEGMYSASISLPGREHSYEPQPVSYAPGVTMVRSFWSDDFTGTAVALVNAGLVLQDHFPGMPGMRNMRVTIYPDGSLPATRVPDYRAKLPGAKRVERLSKTMFEVSIVVDPDEQNKRDAARQIARCDWVCRMMNKPFPPVLVACREDMARKHKSRAPLQLVWSRPASPDIRPESRV